MPPARTIAAKDRPPHADFLGAAGDIDGCATPDPASADADSFAAGCGGGTPPRAGNCDPSSALSTPSTCGGDSCLALSPTTFVLAVLGASLPPGVATASSDGLSSLAGKSAHPSAALGVARFPLPWALPCGSCEVLSPCTGFRPPPLRGLLSRRDRSLEDIRSLRLRSLRPIAGEEWLLSLRRVPLVAEPIGEELGLELADPLAVSSSPS